MYTALDYFVDQNPSVRCRELSDAITERSYYKRCKFTAHELDINIKVYDANHFIYIDVNDDSFRYKPTTGEVKLMNDLSNSEFCKYIKGCRSPECIIKGCYKYSNRRK